MKTIEEIRDVINNSLSTIGFPADVYYTKYSEPHRYFHTIEHIEGMLLKLFNSNMKITDGLIYAIMFHDIVYDPQSKLNELESAKMLLDLSNIAIDKEVYDAILSTSSHIPIKGNKISKTLIDLDMDGVIGGFSNKDMFEEFITGESKIMKEYQGFPYNTYVAGRIKFLKDVRAPRHFIDYVKNKKPNIAVYAGSFNPFTIGHLDILNKAEAIFDKVIIARGYNMDKDCSNMASLPSLLKHHEIRTYDGLLTDFINSFPYEVTLIRGLRNASDFQSEKNMLAYLKGLKPDIKVTYLMCDSKFEHISSSDVRQLQKYGKGDEYIVK